MVFCNISFFYGYNSINAQIWYFIMFYHSSDKVHIVC